MVLDTFANVQISLLVNLLTQHVGGAEENIALHLIRRVKKVSNLGLADTHTFADGDVRISLLLKLKSLGLIGLSLLVLGDGLGCAKLCRRNTKALGDLGFGKPLLLQIIDLREEAHVALVGVVSRAPRITPGVSRRTNMEELVEMVSCNHASASILSSSILRSAVMMRSMMWAIESTSGTCSKTSSFW